MKTLKDLGNLSETESRMPVLFVGHGNPMNGIEDNEFTRGWRQAVENVPQPKAIVVVSAHWETQGTFVTAMPKPRTIYDFSGFPQQLFEAQYPALGSPETAREISANIKQTLIELDEQNWGLDHGTWTILRHLYPDADVPVVQLSLDYTKNAGRHYELAAELDFLRDRGVLIIGSGNIVHNLRKINFHSNGGADWALNANEIFKRLILTGNHKELINYESLGTAVALSVPTPEHYVPLLYALALKSETDEVSFFNDRVSLGSIAMTSVKIG